MTDTRRLSGHLPTLDGWRGIAVLMVIVYHGLGSGYAVFKPLGGIGVSIFFALSGLLICNRLLVEYDRTGRLDLRGFYIRRAFRILPPAYVYLAALVILGAVSSNELVHACFSGETTTWAVAGAPVTSGRWP